MIKPDLPRVLGDKPCAFLLEMGEQASIEVRAHSIGTIEEFGEDGGWWVCLSMVARTPESRVLLLLAAACLARLTTQLVLDDALLLGPDRWIDPERVLALLD